MARPWLATGEPAATNIIPVHAPESPIVELLRSCERIAPSESTVLLTGETGTGKEVFARYIHQRSPRSKGPLVPVNCGAIPESLLESELFGFVRGAFTGAVQPRKGRIALAEGGTLFLDEIGEMPLALQVKLLRLLQDRTYEPIGTSAPLAANFRLVAATNRDLAAEVEAGRFRRDLYYRLLVCPLELPSLRSRACDIPLLFRHFWHQRGDGREVDPAVIGTLCRYEWPGNIRELENLVERLSVCADGPVVGIDDLPPKLKTLALQISAEPTTAPASRRKRLSGPQSGQLGEDERYALQEALGAPPRRPESETPPRTETAAANTTTPAIVNPLTVLEAGVTLPIDLPAVLRAIEEAHIDAALARTGGNKKAAAALLGLQRTTLVEKLRRRGLLAPEPASPGTGGRRP